MTTLLSIIGTRHAGIWPSVTVSTTRVPPVSGTSVNRQWCNHLQGQNSQTFTQKGTPACPQFSTQWCHCSDLPCRILSSAQATPQPSTPFASNATIVMEPSEPSTPPAPTINILCLFQCVCSDFFSYKGFTYLIYVDHYSNWPVIQRSSDGAEGLVNSLHHAFVTSAIPEKLALNGGPEV